MIETAPEPATRQRILIVDDVPANIEILYKILKGDYDISFAKCGADGLRLALQDAPDLILLDVMMPGMDGYQMCAVLKQEPKTAGIPVIFVTAMGAEGDEIKGFERGAIDYITKPISPVIVKARVKNHLELKRSRDLLEQLTVELGKKNRELEVLARKDALTGLANRRHFNEVLDAEIRRANRSGRHLSLILCDVDFFKKFNDHYGHLAGDKCLELIGRLMLGCFKRAGDLPARYGGEEFAVILPDTPVRYAVELAKLLCKELIAAALPHGANLPLGVVTLTAGVVGVQGNRDLDADWLIGEADRALYEAKAAGRNRVKASGFDAASSSPGCADSEAATPVR